MLFANASRTNARAAPVSKWDVPKSKVVFRLGLNGLLRAREESGFSGLCFGVFSRIGCDVGASVGSTVTVDDDEDDEDEEEVDAA